MVASTRASGIWRILTGILLIVVALFHLYLVVVAHVGGTLGVLFVLQSIAALVLAVALFVTRGVLRRIVLVLSLLFLLGSLAALLLALTVGFFGITEVWTFTLVPATVVVEAIGIVVAAIATAVMLRRRAA
ncbi:hypothetical protein [Pseudolysinimonas kribbensis]|uniref:hypothetical protein n=1 Tax=Pseudolysinimonas kribbensis TaxID=433641 RepID=UPI0024E0A0C6|nr:hypothetical protein [Pseudolysinimonas kribbensis]